MNKWFGFSFVIVGAFGFLSVLISSTKPSDTTKPSTSLKTKEKSADPTDQYVNQKVYSLELEAAYDFAGEALPMDNFDVVERLDREILKNTYWHSNTIQCIKLANRYFPVIERILAENNIPDDFKYLSVAESGLRNVSSPAGAKGFWQFMKATGQSYGLTVNKEVDERYHLEKSTQAACKYILKLKEKFGSWTLAAAAYNRGENGLSKEINQQKVDSYYDLNINQETGRYVFRIVALKEILSKQNKFGFYISNKYPPLNDIIHVKLKESNVNLANFAKNNNITYRQLKIYNPWLKSGTLTNSSKKEYTIVLPKK